MKVRAPGKVVLSGAYAVLEGAPALVTAVDRYVIADTQTAADFEAPEARAAIPTGDLPHIDVSATRQDGRKLGVGSSAAIVVASLAAVTWSTRPDLDEQQMARRIWQPAVRAHRAAQGGGSGIDVVTSAFGGTRQCLLEQGMPHSEAFELPTGLAIELYAAREAASTPLMLSVVHSWAHGHSSAYAAIMAALGEASTVAASASDVGIFVEALGEQLTHLSRLGSASGVPIVPEQVAKLAADAAGQGVAVHPSGAGGGDIVLCVGTEASCRSWRDALTRSGFDRLAVTVGARGVHRAEGRRART